MRKEKTFLIDTSAWIDYFRHGKGEIFDLMEVLATCLMAELSFRRGLKDVTSAKHFKYFYSLETNL